MPAHIDMGNKTRKVMAFANTAYDRSIQSRCAGMRRSVAARQPSQVKAGHRTADMTNPEAATGPEVVPNERISPLGAPKAQAPR